MVDPLHVDGRREQHRRAALVFLRLGKQGHPHVRVPLHCKLHSYPWRVQRASRRLIIVLAEVHVGQKGAQEAALTRKVMYEAHLRIVPHKLLVCPKGRAATTTR